MTPNFILTIQKKMGLDAQVSFTLLIRLWNIFTGGVLLVGMHRWFSADEQGYYFTLMSLVGLQVFFELGMNFVVLQISSHEMANVKYSKIDGFSGRKENIERLASLVRGLMKWYKYVAISFLFCVGVAGYYFLEKKSANIDVDWRVSWSLLILFSAGNLYCSPFLAILEGIGLVADVAKLRLIYSVAAYVLFWIVLENGGGLNALPIILAISFLVTKFWLVKEGSKLYEIAEKEISTKNIIQWSVDILPLQWRIALSWISGYLIFQLFTPLIFAFQGATEAGQIGLGLVVYSTISTLSMSWVNSKVPELVGHIVREERRALNVKFMQLLKLSMVFNLVISSGFTVVGIIMKVANIWIGDRLPDPYVLICFFIVCLCNQVIFSVAAYVRAHKEEPMLLQSVVVGLLLAVCLYKFAAISVLYAALSYLVVTLVISLPWALLTFKRYYK